jgi:hypothetical protein
MAFLNASSARVVMWRVICCNFVQAQLLKEKLALADRRTKQQPHKM